MNKYNLKEYLKGQLAPHPATLKSTSYDDQNKEYLCQDETTEEVYDFDAYIADKYSKQQTPASPDAIYIGLQKVYFIEFKNQPYKNIKSGQIKRKFRKGTSVLQSMLEGYDPAECKFIFCVVFKAMPKPDNFDYRHFLQTAARFDLDALNKECGSFYDQILTEDVEFFRKELPGLQC